MFPGRSEMIRLKRPKPAVTQLPVGRMDLRKLTWKQDVPKAVPETIISSIGPSGCTSGFGKEAMLE